MLPSLEDLLAQAKRTGGAADGNGNACLFYDFGKSATSGTVGVKKTGLLIPANTLIESGFMKSEISIPVSGNFNIQLLSASGDVFPTGSGVGVGAILVSNRVFNPTQEREILLNLFANTTGKLTFWMRLLPY